MSDVANLRKARGYAKAKLTRLRNQVLQMDSDTGSEFIKEQAESRLERLEEVYREFEALQRQLLDKIGEFTVDDTSEEELFDEKYYEVKTLLKQSVKRAPVEDVTSRDNDIITQLLQQQNELMQHIGRGAQGEASGENETLTAILSRQTEILDRVSNATGSTVSDNRVKLPTIKLRCFDGKIEEWKCFSDNFRSVIHNKTHLSNIEKFQYLNSSISGDAAKIIESIEITEQNYTTAWDLLQQRYDDPRSLKKKHIECLFSMPTVAKESAKGLRELIDYTLSHLRVLKVLGLPTDMWDELVMHMVETSLDAQTLRAWEEEIELKESVNLKELIDFLRTKCKTLERVESRSIDKNDKSPKDNDKRNKGSSANNAKTHSKGIKNEKTTSLASSLNTGKCYFCNGAHFIYFCEKFLALPVSSRIKEIKRLRLCLNCLRNDHYVKSCKMGSCKECTGRHNTLCHLPSDNDVSAKSGDAKAESNVNNDHSSSNVAVHHAAGNVKRRRVLLATAVVDAIHRNGTGIPIRVLLDSASEANFITQAAHRRLGLKRERTSEIVSGINEVESKVHDVCNVHVKSKSCNFEIDAQCLIVPKITKNLPSLNIDRVKLSIPSNIKLADSTFYKVGPIDMLIGAEFFFELLEVGKIKLENQLTLQNTKFGWTVAGPVPTSALNELHFERNVISAMTCTLKTHETLDENLERFWKLENYDDVKPPSLSIDDQRCEQNFEQTTTRANDGRFIVRLPFREEARLVGDNRDIALKRFNRLERTLQGNKIIRDRYYSFMREYIDLGHMSVATDNIADNKNVVYLPHHDVLKEASSTTKLRVVFDASAKNNKGVSLNDALLVGPVLQDNLIDIVARFRCHKVALTADLQKMFRQVLVHNDDRDYRILWRFSMDEPVSEYRLNTVTYGQACASYLAIRCMRQLATEGSERHPLAATALMNDTYVDDIITGAETVEQARILQEQLTHLLQEGGFRAHKWCSSSKDVLEDIPSDLRESSVTLDIDANDIIRTVGLEWNPNSDEFQFTVPTITSVSTKRKMLSAISRLFDPLGLIGPVLTVAKILMQEIWQVKLEWDAPLPEAFITRWKDFQESLRKVNTLRVPRLVISASGNSRFYMLGFCDASEKAYGACIYIVSVSETCTDATVRLLCSKARVAPLKRQSIPRLELCSALLLARLIDKIRRSISIKIDGIHAWSDSMVVLYWLRGNASRWKPFISNRTVEIISILPASNWRHIKGSENPADLISRGATPAQLKDSRLWWQGPEWLTDLSQWLRNDDLQEKITEEDLSMAKKETRKEPRVCHLSVQQHPSTSTIIDKIIEDCSTLTKMERSLAYCIRFILNCQKKRQERLFTRLTLSELELARCEIIRYSQSKHFPEDLRCLQEKGELSKSSRLHQLHAFLDDNGILRVGGRLQESPWKFERKHPILLPARCKVTRLLIEREHRTLLHANQLLLLAAVRQRYWPLNARNLVRRICHSCVWCARNNPRGLTQAMGSLPSDRIKPSRAFTITGVDFAGPVITLVDKRRGRKTCNSYIALFICFSTRAIHLEATSELSTAAFLATLRRFIGRRGLPRKICSDNATNFVGAKRELDELYTFLHTSIDGPVGDVLSEKGIEWSFIPPHSPHLGGLWEAGVKSCKYHLRRAMGNVLYTFEELTTVLVQIEACLNSRPLSPLSSDPSDLLPLTPGHFLVGGPLTSLPDMDVSEVKINRLDRWEMIQRSVQEFWKRWAAEYVANLQSRVKWRSKQDNLKVDDFVLLKDDNLPPMKWKTGRVIEVHPGKDNLVRVASVRTASGVAKRAINKLCKLPVNDDIDKED